MSASRAASRAVIMTVRLMGGEMGRFQRFVELAGPEYLRMIAGVRLRPDDAIDANWSAASEPVSDDDPAWDEPHKDHDATSASSAETMAVDPAEAEAPHTSVAKTCQGVRDLNSAAARRHG